MTLFLSSKYIEDEYVIPFRALYKNYGNFRQTVKDSLSEQGKRQTALTDGTTIRKG